MAQWYKTDAGDNFVKYLETEVGHSVGTGSISDAGVGDSES